MRRGVAAAVLGALVTAAPAAGQAFLPAVEAGQEAVHQMSLLVELLTREQRRAVRADKAAAEIAKARQAFAQAQQQMYTEIRALQVNPERNRVELERLQRLQADAVQIQDRLRYLSGLVRQGQAGEYSVDLTQNTIAAIRGGTVQQTLDQLKSYLERLKGAVETQREELSRTATDVVGSVEIRSVQMYRGELVFYMEDHLAGRGWTEVAVRPGREIPIRSLPVLIRAAIQDETKKTLAQKLQQTRTVDYVGSGDGREGQVFQYRGTPGETTWRTRGETYKWEADRADRWTVEHVRRVAARDSSRYARGDVVEIHPATGTAQNLVFYVEASTQGWQRESNLGGKRESREMEPRNGVASARVVISVFPK